MAGEARLERNVGALDERQAALGREWEALAALASDGRDALGHERQRISDSLSDMRALRAGRGGAVAALLCGGGAVASGGRGGGGGGGAGGEHTIYGSML